MVKENLFFTFLTTLLTYTLLLILFENIDLQILSSIALSLVLFVSFFLRKKLKNDFKIKHDILNLNFFFSYIDLWSKKNASIYSFLTVIMSAFVGIFSLYLLLGSLNLEAIQGSSGLDVKNIILTTNTISIFLVQVGGWVIQAFLIHFLAIIFDGEQNFNKYLKIIGLAYVAYLIGAIISLFYNQITASGQVLPYEDFENLMNNNIILKLVGKSAEYLALIYISYGLMKLEKFSYFRALLVSFLPSILLIVLKLIFENIFKL